MPSFQYKMPTPKEVSLSAAQDENLLSQDIEENLHVLMHNVEQCVPDDYNVKNFKILVRIDKYDDAIRQSSLAAQQSYARIKEALMGAGAINSENFTSEHIQGVLDLAFYEHKYMVGDGLNLKLSAWASFGAKLSLALATFFLIFSIIYSSDFLPLVVTFLSGSFLIATAGTDKKVRMLFVLLMLYPFMIAGYYFSYQGFAG